MKRLSPTQNRLITLILFLLPIFIALFIWASPLSFVPVPWPDDSAFYFVAKDLFKWPPRWVMLPQAPFEPTYRLFNFNTMPLYPILIGLGRWIEIDGSHGIKFWPLSFFAMSGSLLGLSLFRARLPFLLALLFTLGFALNPGLRWASVLVRPESLIGFCAMALVLGITLGFPRRLRAEGLWDPIAALLAIAAYSHFNAIHLIFPVIAAFLSRPKRLIEIATRTTLYLSPWLILVVWHWRLFVHQMTTQWTRLAVPNGWLKTPGAAIESLFQSMGSPLPWPPELSWAAALLWVFLLSALAAGILYPLCLWTLKKLKKKPDPKGLHIHHTLNLAPASAWVLGAAWLWNNKPEVWFTYYLQAAIWTFASLAALKAWQSIRSPKPDDHRLGYLSLGSISLCAMAIALIFLQVDFSQTQALAKSPSWKWSTYREFIDCIDQNLSQQEAALGYPKPFRVWDPTFPDITVELSRRHPDWELTRTNDFWERRELAIAHGHQAHAVVVPETLQMNEADITGPAAEHPQVQSLWMNWQGYFLNQLWIEPGWKTKRSICQRGRWMGFIFQEPFN